MCNRLARCIETPTDPAILRNFTSTWTVFAGLRLFEEFHLSRRPLAHPPPPWQTDVAKDSLDDTDGDTNVVNAAQPKLSTLGTVLELVARPFR
jgi:hypothetical protein